LSLGWGEEKIMNRRQIERSFVDSGWEVCESSSPHLLLVGKADDLSILAYRALAVTDDPIFELIDYRRGTTHWVRAVPTPRVAQMLLEERGGFAGRSLVDKQPLGAAHRRSTGGWFRERVPASTKRRMARRSV
jgi:hypothetical protein